MPHVIDVDGSRTVLRSGVDLGRNGGRPLLRFVPLESGDLVVFAPAGAALDGRPMVGGIAVVSWGAGALVRARDLRVVVRWEHAREIRSAPAGSRCGLCFGPAASETVVVCYCRTPVHEDCFAVLINCSSCGEAA
jgi:hypothetical protein